MTAATANARFSLGSSRAVWFTLLLVLAHWTILFGVGGLLGRGLLAGGSPYDGSAGAFLLLFVVGGLDAAVLVLLLRLGAGLRLEPLGWRRPEPADLFLGGMGLLLCLAIAFGTARLTGIVDHVIGSIRSFTPQQRVFFVFLGTLAAFGEETIFRGHLQPHLQAKLGRGAGLVLTAVLFALYHLKLRPLRLLSLVCLGLVYGGLRDRTGKLWAPALAHALFWVVMGNA